LRLIVGSVKTHSVSINLRKFLIDCWLGQDTVSVHSPRKVSDWLLARQDTVSVHSPRKSFWLIVARQDTVSVQSFLILIPTIRSYAVIQDSTDPSPEVSVLPELVCSCCNHLKEGTVLNTPYFRFRRFFDSRSNSFVCLINFWFHGYVVINSSRYVNGRFFTPNVPGFHFVCGLRFSDSKFLEFYSPIPTSNFEILNLLTYLVPRLPAPFPQSFSDPTVRYPYIRWLTDFAANYSIVRTSSVAPYFGTSFDLIRGPYSIRIAPFGLHYIPPRVFARPSQYHKFPLLPSPDFSVLRSTRRWIDWYCHWKRSKSLID
jgi:hypothetical protein